MKRITWIVVAAVLAIVAGGLSFVVDLYFDLLWYQEMQQQVVFTTMLYARGALAGLVILGVFIFLYANLMVAHKGPGSIQIGIPTPQGQITAYTFPPEMLRRVIGLASLIAAFLFGVRASHSWEKVWLWLNRAPFGQADPIFGKDVSFFVFVLPMLEETLRLCFFVTLLAAAGSIALYHFKGILAINRLRDANRRGRPGMHLSLLAGLFFLLLSADAWVDRFLILYSAHGPLYGASYADIHGRLPLLTLLAICAIVGAALWLYNAFAARNLAAVLAIAFYVFPLIAVKAYPAILQKFVVAPNELGRESPQIEHNIRATLQGYGLDKVEERDLSAEEALTPQDISRNAATIRSIRLWDHQPLLDAFSQIQEIRTYYTFSSVDNDRYAIDGIPQQMMLSVRELDSASLPERNWINEHLSYTHGYGLTLGPVNRVTTEGLPVLLVQDIPPRSSLPMFQIARPEVYFGEKTTRYVAVLTGAKEFDYPAGEENVFTTYKGTGGVPVQSLWRKLLFAIYFKDPNIVLSPLVKPESRFLYYRDIKTRLNRLAPFLLLDQDPYIVISEGRLFWIQDAYTRTDRYPYSTPMRGVGNYIRNSVKLVLDAYNGSVELYVADPADPLVQAYGRIFPGLLKPLGELSADLRAHLRYPEDIFRIQTSIYAVYHMTNPQIFYNKEDLWEIPVLGQAGSEAAMAPYYTIMRLPRESREEFILMLPYTPGRKDNLSAWMVARSDGEYYGQLVVYRFPKKKLVYGPKQIAARINQDAEISRQLTLWDQRGSQVMQGTLLVIPVQEALLYVRPLYLRAESGKIPELKRVIVAYENRIAMEETLEASIANIFRLRTAPGAAPSPATEVSSSAPAPPAEGGTAELIRQAKEAYDRATDAQRQGNWARYGEELSRLGTLIEELRKRGK